MLLVRVRPVAVLAHLGGLLFVYVIYVNWSTVEDTGNTGYIRRMSRPEQFPIKFQFAISEEMEAALNKWRRGQPAPPNRSEAIRRLVELGLTCPVKPQRATDEVRRAASLAAEKHALDQMDRAMKGETDSIKATRKKQLTSMPGGFKRR